MSLLDMPSFPSESPGGSKNKKTGKKIAKGKGKKTLRKHPQELTLQGRSVAPLLASVEVAASIAASGESASKKKCDSLGPSSPDQELKLTQQELRSACQRMAELRDLCAREKSPEFSQLSKELQELEVKIAELGVRCVLLLPDPPPIESTDSLLDKRNFFAFALAGKMLKADLKGQQAQRFKRAKQVITWMSARKEHLSKASDCAFKLIAQSILETKKPPKKKDLFSSVKQEVRNLEALQSNDGGPSELNQLTQYAISLAWQKQGNAASMKTWSKYMNMESSILTNVCLQCFYSRTVLQRTRQGPLF